MRMHSTGAGPVPEKPMGKGNVNTRKQEACPKGRSEFHTGGSKHQAFRKGKGGSGLQGSDPFTKVWYEDEKEKIPERGGHGQVSPGLSATSDREKGGRGIRRGTAIGGRTCLGEESTLLESTEKWVKKHSGRIEIRNVKTGSGDLGQGSRAKLGNREWIGSQDEALSSPRTEGDRRGGGHLKTKNKTMGVKEIER